MSEKAIMLPVITESPAGGSQRLTWAATPRLAYMQQLVLAAPVGGHRFLLECQFHCDYLPSQTHVAHFTALNTKKHDLVISPTCWHYKAGDIASWVHSEHRQGKELGQRDVEGKQIFLREVDGAWRLSLLLCFSENEAVSLYSVILVIPDDVSVGAGIQQPSHNLFCARSPQNTLLPGTFRPANKMPIIADPPPPLPTWGSSGALGSEPVAPVDSALRASGKSEGRKCSPHRKTGQAARGRAGAEGTGGLRSCGVALLLLPSGGHSPPSELPACTANFGFSVSAERRWEMGGHKFEDDFACQGFTGCLWWTAGRQVTRRCSRAPGKSVLGNTWPMWPMEQWVHAHRWHGCEIKECGPILMNPFHL